MIANQPDSRTLRWRRYPGYKDSGVEWLGKVPHNWDIQRLKFVAELQMGQSPPSEDYSDTGEGLPFLQGTADFGPKHPVPRIYCSIPAKAALEGDHLVSVRAPVGAVNTADQDYGIGRGLCAVRPRQSVFHSRYARYEIHAMVWQLASIASGSTYDAVSVDEVGSLICLIPSLEEQLTIATFLDRETAKVDALIAKKERLIELLQEKRIALITQAVTKGLPSTGSGQAPNVPMKDSGVEWLGEIPAHWELRRNKLLFTEADDRSEYGDEELLTVSHITGVTPRSEKEVYMFMAESTVGYKRCQMHDVAINTMWAYMGALGAARCAGIVSPSYNVYRVRGKDLLPEYFDLICRMPGYIAQINRHSKGVWKSRLRLYPDAFYEMLTPIPPTEEQRRIAEAVHHQDEEMQPLAHGLQTSIDYLKEYRTVLISAAVTGRIDVREEAA